MCLEIFLHFYEIFLLSFFFLRKKNFTYLGTDESDGSKSVAVAASLSEPSGESVMPSSISSRDHSYIK